MAATAQAPGALGTAPLIVKNTFLHIEGGFVSGLNYLEEPQAMRRVASEPAPLNRQNSSWAAPDTQLVAPPMARERWPPPVAPPDVQAESGEEERSCRKGRGRVCEDFFKSADSDLMDAVLHTASCDREVAEAAQQAPMTWYAPCSSTIMQVGSPAGGPVSSPVGGPSFTVMMMAPEAGFGDQHAQWCVDHTPCPRDSAPMHCYPTKRTRRRTPKDCKFCSGCGAALLPDFNFCQFCGAPIGLVRIASKT